MFLARNIASRASRAVKQNPIRTGLCTDKYTCNSHAKCFHTDTNKRYLFKKGCVLFENTRSINLGIYSQQQQIRLFGSVLKKRKKKMNKHKLRKLRRKLRRKNNK